MLRSYSCFYLAVILVASVVTKPAHAEASDTFEVQKVAEGVYAAIRKEPPGLTVNANSIFIFNDGDVIVVDTTLTPGSAKEVLAALLKLTKNQSGMSSTRTGTTTTSWGTRSFAKPSMAWNS